MNSQKPIAFLCLPEEIFNEKCDEINKLTNNISIKKGRENQASVDYSLDENEVVDLRRMDLIDSKYLENIKALKSNNILDNFNNPDVCMTFTGVDDDILVEFHVTLPYEHTLSYDFNKIYEYWNQEKERLIDRRNRPKEDKSIDMREPACIIRINENGNNSIAECY